MTIRGRRAPHGGDGRSRAVEADHCGDTGSRAPPCAVSLRFSGLFPAAMKANIDLQGGGSRCRAVTTGFSKEFLIFSWARQKRGFSATRLQVAQSGGIDR